MPIYARIQEWLDRQLAGLQEQYQGVLATPKAGLGSGPFEHFLKLYEEYSWVTQDKMKDLAERVKREIPGFRGASLKKIMAVFEWVSRWKALQSKTETCKRMSVRMTAAFIQRTLAHLKEERSVMDQEALEMHEKEEKLEKMKSYYHSIKLWREKRMEEMVQEAAVRQEELRANLRLEEERQAKELKRRTLIQEKLAAYHQDVEAKQREQEQVARLLEEKKLEEKQLLSQFNETRVRWRKSETQRKLRAHEAKVEQMKREKLQLEQRLEQLCQSVAVHVERDWNRATQQTVSHHNKTQHDTEVEWYKINGFSMEQVLKDPRMQLSIALHRSGLGQSKYGNQVLKALEPPVQRPDLATTFKLEHKS
ncbi:hypothetical protein HDU91_000925 [Kappamyces sp. JEL0680]|nr:hypothetical protein HDU91_000925 [Kappamyces sp. JEL0680]